SSAGRYCSINLLLLIRDVLQRLFALRFGREALGGLFLEVLDKLIGIAFDQFNRLIPIRRILIRLLGKLSSPNYERSLRFAPNLVVLEGVSTRVLNDAGVKDMHLSGEPPVESRMRFAHLLKDPRERVVIADLDVAGTQADAANIFGIDRAAKIAGLR